MTVRIQQSMDAGLEIHTEDALGNWKEYTVLEVVDVENGVTPYNCELTPAVKREIEKRDLTIVKDADIVKTGYQPVAYTTLEGRMQVSFGDMVWWHDGHLINEPFILEEVSSRMMEWGEDAVLVTNRGEIAVNEEHMEVDESLVGELCCITVTSKRWTGMEWDKNHQLVRCEDRVTDPKQR